VSPRAHPHILPPSVAPIGLRGDRGPSEQLAPRCEPPRAVAMAVPKRRAKRCKHASHEFGASSAAYPTPRCRCAEPGRTSRTTCFRALLRRRVRNVPLVALGGRPVLPWALFPFKVLRRPMRDRRPVGGGLHRSRDIILRIPVRPPSLCQFHRIARDCSREEPACGGVCSDGESSVTVAESRRAPSGSSTDLHGVCDVKERSEERSPRPDSSSAPTSSTLTLALTFA
jgi:hypothetical protein